MANLVLIETLKSGVQTQLNLSALQTLTVNPDSSYQIIDADTHQPPKNLVLKREDDELKIEVDGESVASIEDFFVSNHNASFITGDGANSPITASSMPITDADAGVVWEASDTADSGFSVGSALLYGAGALGAIALANHSNSDDTPTPIAETPTPTPTPAPTPTATYDLTVAAAVGQLQSVVNVIVYDDAGNIIASQEHDFSTGAAVLSIENAYTGPLLVKVVDINDADGDYIDESTNQLTSLGGDLRAMTSTDGENDVDVSITLLTELAVRQAGITDNNQVTEENLSVNDTVGELFGVVDIIAPATPVTDNSYDGTDGLSPAEIYGNVLAVLSGANNESDSIDASLTLLSDNIVTQDNGQLSLNQDGVDALTAGASIFANGVNADLADLSETLGVIDSIAPTVIAFSSNASNGTYIIGGAIEINATLSESIQAGDSIIVTLGTGETVTLIAPNAGTTLTGTYTVNASTNGLQVSSYSIVSLTDNAGNIATSTELPETNIDVGVVVDSAAPTVTGFSTNAGNGTYSIGDSIEFMATLSEGVQADDSIIITLESGETITLIASSDGTTLTGTYTVNASTSADGLLVSSYSVVSLTDNAGNMTTSTALPETNIDTNINIVLDSTGPTVTIELDASSLKTGETATVTFTFSDAPTDFTEADVSVENGTLSAFTVTANANVYTATFTPTADLEDAINMISVGTGYTDSAGNSGAAANSANYAIDTENPTVAITLSDSALKAGETSTVTFTFNEAPTDFTEADVSVENGTLSAFTVTADDNVYTATFTPTDDLEDATNVISVGAAFTDAVGNAGSAVSSANYAIDSREPSVAITLSDTTLKAGETTTVTFTFISTPNGFTEADVSVENGTLSAFTVTADDKVYTAIFTPTDDIEDATNTISVGAAYTDAAGNTGIAADSPNYAIDTENPTVAITLSDSALKAGETSTVTLTFSEAPTGFTEADVSVENGTLSGFTVTANDNIYTATFTPTDNVNDTTNIISVGAAFTDAAGNSGAAADSANYTIETTVPTLTSSSPSDDAGNVALNADIVLTFNENIALDTGNIVISDGNETLTIDVENHAGQLSINNNILTINPTNDLSNYGANYNIQIADSAIANIAGNTYAGITDTTSLDFTTEPDPTVVFDLTIGESSSHTSRTFDANTSYTIYIIVNTYSHQLQEADLWSGAENLGTDDTIILVGNSPPDYPFGPAGGTVTTTFGGNQWMSSSATSSSTYAAALDPSGTFTRLVSSADAVRLWSEPEGSFTYPVLSFDFALPVGLAAAQNLVDTKAPARPSPIDMSTDSDSGSNTFDNITNNNTPGFTGQFTPSGIGTAEVNSTITLISSIDGVVGTTTASSSGNGAWSMTASTLSDGTHDMTVTSTDAAGNISQASFAEQIIIDTTQPTVAITMDDTDLAIGETATATFTFSEAPIGFTVADITAENGTFSAFTVTGDNTVYTATLTPTVNINDQDNIISVNTNYEDTAGNTGASGVSSNYTVNTPLPADTSIVIFDLTQGSSSSHSSRTFDPNVEYDIYIIVNSVSTDISLQVLEVWASADSLGADDTITLVGTGNPILGRFGGSVTVGNSAQWLTNATAITTTPIAARLNSSSSGLFTRYNATTAPSVRLWNGNVSTSTNAPNYAFSNAIPAGILTSQGLS